MRWVHIITCCFAHLSILWLAYEDYRALRGMHKSVCKCLLLKQNRHLIPTGQELQHCTLWNLNSHSDYGDPPAWPCYSLAQVSHSSQYSLNPAHTRLARALSHSPVCGVDSWLPWGLLIHPSVLDCLTR